MMRSNILGRAFLACWCGIAAYCLLSSTLGPAGVVAYRGLEARVSGMRASLDRLAGENAALSANLESLRSDPSRAATEARALGYIANGERAIVVARSRDEPGAAMRGGDGEGIVRFEDECPLSDAAIKEISFALGFLAFGLATALDIRRKGFAGLPRGGAGRSFARWEGA